MPCWPDLWEATLKLRWLAEPVAILLVIALMLWAPLIRWLWLRVLLRIIGGSAALFIIFIVGFAMLLNPGKSQYRTASSPDGSHQAVLMYEAGFLGRDFSSVKITKKGCCKHFTAYEYAGPSNITGTTVTWLDGSHLQIQFYADHDRYQRCETRIADITIDCVPLSPR